MTYDSGLLADDPRSTVGLDGPAGLGATARWYEREGWL